MNGTNHLLRIMLDPDDYLHPARVTMAAASWRTLSKVSRNTIIFAEHGLHTASPDVIPTDPPTSALLRCWNAIPDLCLLLGLFSQRADWLASGQYRRLDGRRRRFLELPLPHRAVPPCARAGKVDPAVCGLAALRLAIPGMHEVIAERLGLLFSARTDADATALSTQLQRASPVGYRGWISHTLLSMATSYAQPLTQDLWGSPDAGSRRGVPAFGSASRQPTPRLGRNGQEDRQAHRR
ncbi:hypothetical protein OVY01_08165 [Robbsia sp. Bb-Pol-6]|uniref:Uncharacterized protein n=1 Tax=Robbsia betulipollinis TaxID=2981849 RepID=A0ABT3ZKY5_9BURK|nr:hypothetical protein [Robbsia betulipollinis]MCY0387206.1 hypothetical protein [Robbsia betulipollinis]